MKPTEQDLEKARDVRDAWCGDNPEVLSQTRNGPLSQHIAQAIADERNRVVAFMREAAGVYRAADTSNLLGAVADDIERKAAGDQQERLE